MPLVTESLPEQQPCVVTTDSGTTEGYYNGTEWLIPVRGPDEQLIGVRSWEYMTASNEIQPNPLMANVVS